MAPKFDRYGPLTWTPPRKWYVHALERKGKRKCRGCEQPFKPDPLFKKQFWCESCRTEYPKVKYSERKS